MTCTSMSISALTNTSTISDPRCFHETSSVSSSSSRRSSSSSSTTSSTSKGSIPSPLSASSVYPSFGAHHPLVGSPPLSPEISLPPLLTLQERRVRNKAASAKYRQKKNQQQCEMQRLMHHITEQNAILERQVQDLKNENDRLQRTTDRMRGKLVARKMLRRWMLKEGQPKPLSSLDHRKGSAFHPAGYDDVGQNQQQQQPIGNGDQGEFDLLYSDDESF